MTAETNGVPEDDDPFAYLYRAEGEAAVGDGAEAPTRQQSVPRRDFAGAAQVGRYGQRPAQGAYPQQPTAPYGQLPQQAAPPVPPPGGGRAANRGSGGRSSGGNGRGVMIGAAAVVVAVAVGIGIALFNSSGSSRGSATPSASSSGGQSNDTASPSAGTGSLPGVVDADTLVLGGVSANNDHTGARSKDGKFVETMPQGSSVQWTVNVPKAGFYRLYVRYANAGPDSGEAVTVNGTPNHGPIKLNNYSHSSDWDHAWYFSWAGVQLKSGSNTITLSTSAPNQGNVNIDQLAIAQNSDGSKPSTW